MEVYLDLMVMLNVTVDLLLLAGTNRLSGYPVQWRRLFPAAALGGLYSGLCVLREFRFLWGTPWRLLCLAGMAVVAFGCNRSAWKRCAVFVLLTMTMGGIAAGFGKADLPTLILSAGGLLLLCKIAFGDGIGKREYLTVSIRSGGRTVTVIGLQDTGNTLRDPVTGEPVLIISARAACDLTGLTREQLSTPLETLRRNPGMGLRLIPFHAVGQKGGMMLGMRFADVRIGSRSQSTVVAFAPEGVGEGDCHQALIATI